MIVRSLGGDGPVHIHRIHCAMCVCVCTCQILTENVYGNLFVGLAVLLRTVIIPSTIILASI